MHVNTFNGALLMELDDFEWNIMLSVLSVLLTLGICQHLKKGHLYLEGVFVMEATWEIGERDLNEAHVRTQCAFPEFNVK